MKILKVKYYQGYKVCIDLNISCVGVFHLHVFCPPHVYSAPRGQKRMLDPLGHDEFVVPVWPRNTIKIKQQEPYYIYKRPVSDKGGGIEKKERKTRQEIK